MPCPRTNKQEKGFRSEATQALQHHELEQKREAMMIMRTRKSEVVTPCPRTNERDKLFRREATKALQNRALDVQNEGILTDH